MKLVNKIRQHPYILFSCGSMSFEFDLLYKIMRLLIVQFYFDGTRQFDFFMCAGGSFVFKTNSLNHWTDLKNEAAWNKEFCELFNETDSLNGTVKKLTVADAIYDRDSLEMNYIAAFQMLTNYFHIQINQDGLVCRAEFRNGELENYTETRCICSHSETIIEFKIDENILSKYDGFSLYASDFYHMTQLCAAFFSNSKITAYIRNGDILTQQQFYYPSLGAYAEAKYGYACLMDTVFHAQSSATERVQSDAEIRIAMAASSNMQNNIEAYCNFYPLQYGKIFDAVEDALKHRKQHYNVVIHVFSSYPMWTNASKKGIENQYVYNSIHKFISYHLSA